MPKESIDAVFTEQAQQRLMNAIGEAEAKTSGQIRLHVEARCKEDVMDHAAFIFEQLEMHKTEERNGVLFYFSLLDHKFAILGDAGINQKVPAGYWDRIRDEMLAFFKKSDYVGGLVHGIREAGLELAEDFPRRDDNQNELSDEISFGV
jgi:uncharacterized membrane protein